MSPFSNHVHRKDARTLTIEISSFKSCFWLWCFCCNEWESLFKKARKATSNSYPEKWIVAIEAENAKKQLKGICSRKSVIEKCKSYKRYGNDKKRIDKFWLEILDSEGCPKEGQKIMKMIMFLSYGNADVERRFSVNSDCLWENMKEDSIIARRRAFDHVTDRWTRWIWDYSQNDTICWQCQSQVLRSPRRT